MQFAFLKLDFPEIYEQAAKAESVARNDTRTACTNARFALEIAINWLYDSDSTLTSPYERTLAARIHEQTFVRLVGPPRVANARIVKDYGNLAVHDARPVPAENAITSLRELFPFYLLAGTNVWAKLSSRPRPDI